MVKLITSSNLLLRGQTGEAWRPNNSDAVSKIGYHQEKVLHVVFKGLKHNVN